jgi:hypothetical protein
VQLAVLPPVAVLVLVLRLGLGLGLARLARAGRQ